MKRIQIILCLFIFIYSTALGQTCLSGYTTFSTQGQIDSFAINNPGCTEVLGNLIIQESTLGNISNLNGLNPITEINGYLHVFCNEDLETLAGLENLTAVGGSVDITKNPSLNSLSALSNITEYFDYFSIINNQSLLNLNGLENLAIVHEGFYVNTNSNLTDISALSNLKYVGESIELTGLISLIDFTGLSGLDTVEATLFIKGNDELESLTGLNNLKYVGGLDLAGNFVLDDITALSNLETLKGSLFIQNNFTLPSLSGLDNFIPDSLDFLFIQACNNLTYCHVKSICDYLDTGGDHFIEFNENNCNSSEEILSWCDSVSTSLVDLSLDIELFPNPTSDKIQIVTNSNLKLKNELSDASGKILQNGFDNAIDLSAYANGLYFIKLTANEQSWIERIVKN